jgi:hypothetical protein
MKTLRIAVALGALSAFSIAASSCSSSQSQSFTDAGSGTDTGGDDAMSSDDSSMGSDVTFGGDDGSGSMCDAASIQCSADLHSVLDCKGNVIKTCPAGQGCGKGGTCVAACTAAEQNQSSIGCEYWDVQPANDGSCFALYIANTWTSDVTIAVDFMGQAINVPAFSRIPTGSGANITYGMLPNNALPPGKVAIVFLNSTQNAATGCPLTGANPAGAAASGTGIFHAFHITTTAPVVAYDIYPYGGGNSFVTSATLLIPTSAWDTNYVAVAPYPFGTNETNPRTAIIGLEDSTTVKIRPSAAIVGGGGVAAAPQGQTATYMVNKGEVLQFEQMAELTGSPIQSDKPVGVWGTQDCINIDMCCCDSAHQQLPPVRALGHEYVAARYRDRVDNMDETPPWRIVGAIKGTTLTYDPNPPPTGAPTTLAAGQVVSFRASGPFVVRSQDDKHPFYLGSHMTGGGAYMGNGDPEWVNVIPAQEYMTDYVFFTDPTYPETDLVLVRGKDQKGMYQDVTLDCLKGPVTGWAAVGMGGQYEMTHVDLVRHNFAPQNGCDNGRHEMKSGGPFGLTVWGWGTMDTQPSFTSTYTSYGYPAGASVQPINQVVVPPTPQ